MLETIIKFIPHIQITLSVILILSILLQHSGSESGGAFGSGSNSFHATRRGFEKFIFYLSIICGILFALLAILVIIMPSLIKFFK
jgi:protein translocase SecG subunit